MCSGSRRAIWNSYSLSAVDFRIRSSKEKMRSSIAAYYRFYVPFFLLFLSTTPPRAVGSKAKTRILLIRNKYMLILQNKFGHIFFIIYSHRLFTHFSRLLMSFRDLFLIVFFLVVSVNAYHTHSWNSQRFVFEFYVPPLENLPFSLSLYIE